MPAAITPLLKGGEVFRVVSPAARCTDDQALPHGQEVAVIAVAVIAVAAIAAIDILCTVSPFLRLGGPDDDITKH